jgi:hypothetical protein|tara:strand:+ start:4233 stop:5069 length:837 start_codon:yes stop_codon:yes gene_type:complete
MLFQIIKKSLFNDLSETKVYAESYGVDVESTTTEFLTWDEKRECVLNDPKFGMFSLFQYTINNYKSNTVFCSKVFTPTLALPLLVFVSQWLMFIAIGIHQYRLYSSGVCSQVSPIESKLLMFAVSLLYFVNSFSLWDDVVDRTRCRKMIPSTAVAMLDSFQEFSFSLFVYVSNLLIILVTDDVPDMLFNCLALDFVMDMDNQFERQYFRFNPDAAVDIYDNLFVHNDENSKIVAEKMKSTPYCICRSISWLPFKILTVLFMLLPFFCLSMMVVGTFCK